MCNGYIISYKNPDADSVCCSIAYSLYAKKKNQHYVPYIYGDINSETLFVLSKINYELNTNIVFDNSKNIIIVDTHNISQLPHLKNINNVIEIYDHHKDGNINDFKNAKIINLEIGAAASILINKIISENLMDKEIAILLGSAVLSNTINFTANTTSNYDRDAFDLLKPYFNFDTEYINNLFDCKENFLNSTEEEILLYDIKKFEFNENIVLLSQVETYYKDNILNKNIIQFMTKYIKEVDCNILALNIIDLNTNKSIVVCVDSYTKQILSEIFDITIDSDITYFNRILLRKSDFIPSMKAKLNGVK